jgi:hypothetical protein
MKADNIISSINYIKKNCPKLHLYICGKLLEKTRVNIIEMRQLRFILGSVFHIPKGLQTQIIKELIEMKLLIRKNKYELIITITKSEYENLIAIR